ncbi:chitin-binding protein [Pseudomonas sp. GW456-E7]|nr:chitin-binding protein [Pseudomonas sp. GW456-E7]
MAAFLVPTLIWAHGAVDDPASRQVYCRALPDFWGGSSDPACKAVHEVNGTYPGQQWNEVSKEIKDYNDQSTVEESIPDGELCSAADKKNKNGLNLPLATWHKTTIRPVNGETPVRIIGTALHVPSFVKIYLSKPGYNAATTELKWSDLDLIYEAQLTKDDVRTNWGEHRPKVDANAYFEFDVKIPQGRSGDAVLFTRWQRKDPAGEGFYNCSDITIASGGTPDPLHDLGPFIASGMDRLKPGDSVHFRIMDDTPAAKEIVNITHPIDQSNLNQNVWGRQVAEQVGSNIAKIGEKNGSNVVFNTTNAAANSVYATKEAYTKAMSIISGGGETPVNPTPPEARITGPTSLVSGQTYTFSGKSSVGYNGKLDFNWTPAGDTGTINADTVTFKAFPSTVPAEHTVLLTVVDRQNKTSHQAKLKVIINPADSGSYPPYVKNKTPPYAPNEKVSNKGANYQCKGSTASGWCSQSPPHYEPGVGSDWTDAWDKID